MAADHNLISGAAQFGAGKRLKAAAVTQQRVAVYSGLVLKYGGAGNGLRRRDGTQCGARHIFADALQGAGLNAAILPQGMAHGHYDLLQHGIPRALAHAGHYPAIDVLQSVSRLVSEIVSPEVLAAGQTLRAALAAFRDKEDLISIGAYQQGTDPRVDAALAHRAQIDAFLRQAPDDPTAAEDADTRLLALARELGGE